MHLNVQGKLYPEDPLAALRVDEILALWEDLANAIVNAMGESDPDARKAIREKHLHGLGGSVKKYLESLAEKNGAVASGCMVGTSTTIAGTVHLARGLHELAFTCLATESRLPQFMPLCFVIHVTIVEITPSQ